MSFENDVLWTRETLAAALSLAAPLSQLRFNASSVEVRPRACSLGSLFIAVERGESEDTIAGEIGAAFGRGAVAAVTQRDLQHLRPDRPVWRIDESPQLALRKLARAARARFGGQVVAVTGSVGKTSTTRFVHHILGSLGRSSSRNDSNPGWTWVTVANAPAHYDYLAVEIPIDRPDTMNEKAGAARPHIGLITNIGVSHRTNYSSRRQILREKAIMLDHLEGQRCAVISQSVLDFDVANERVIGTKKLSRLITVGVETKADVHLCSVSSNGATTSGTMSVFGTEYPFRLVGPGAHFAENAMMAVAVAYALALPVADAIGHLESATLPNRRMQRWRVQTTAGFMEVIDDSFNAAPVSVLALLRVLKERKANRKVLVLGDMLELGPHSERHHADLAPVIVDAHVEALFTVGKLSRVLSESSDVPTRMHFETARDAALALPSQLSTGDLIAVKASNGIGLDLVVDAIAPPALREPAPVEWLVEASQK